MRPVFLIGFMGCGKTTLGRAVAERAGLRFVDLDNAVEARAGMPISQIFDTRGEETFRRLEAEELARAAAMTDVIVACGGGTPCRRGNMELMNRTGTTVWLAASTERLIPRLIEGQAKRPLLAGMNRNELQAFAAASLAKREPFYALAHKRFDSSRLENIDEINHTATQFLSLL